MICNWLTYVVAALIVGFIVYIYLSKEPPIEIDEETGKVIEGYRYRFATYSPYRWYYPYYYRRYYPSYYYSYYYPYYRKYYYSTWW